ncbi:MAG: hypothetical protein KC553_07575 [Nitrospina sp.]|nr:hypothetical protein [Nitrospina sp.]
MKVFQKIPENFEKIKIKHFSMFFVVGMGKAGQRGSIRFFPIFNTTGPDFKQWMEPRRPGVHQPAVVFPAAVVQLASEMGDLKIPLASRHRDFFSGCGAGWKFFAVERVAPPVRLVTHCVQIKSDRTEWIGLFAEALKLGMIFVTARVAFQNFFSQQAFPPQGHEPLRVEKFGMDRPEAHGRASLCRKFRCQEIAHRKVLGARPM